MTEKQFWVDPYQTKLDTTVTSVKGDLVSLQETIIYPFSGGQEPDHGRINGIQVQEVHKHGRELAYRLEPNHALAVGDSVRIEIDWERRYRLMRLHFAAELILELAYQNLEGIEKIGAHIAEDKARLDFIWPVNISESFAGLLESAHQLIAEDQSIISDFSDREKELRYWDIPGFARVSCGGTHLKRTGEVGTLLLKRKNIGKGKERIEISLKD